jgi:hypothetical protein
MPTPMQIEDALRRSGVGAPMPVQAPAAPASAPIQWSKGGRTPDEEKARQRALIEALRARS